MVTGNIIERDGGIPFPSTVHRLLAIFLCEIMGAHRIFPGVGNEDV